MSLILKYTQKQLFIVANLVISWFESLQVGIYLPRVCLRPLASVMARYVALFPSLSVHHR